MTTFEKPGWVQYRNGDIAWCFGKGPCSHQDYVVAAQHVDGDILGFCLDGKYQLDDEDQWDLVRYLPDCTGFDWKPGKKYRPFASGEEFRPFRAMWWRFKSKPDVWVPPAVYSNIDHLGQPWLRSYEEKEFEDNTPFGIEEEQ